MERAEYKRIKKEIATDERMLRSVERAKYSPLLQQEVENLSHESLHRLHDLIESSHSSGKDFLDYLKGRAESSGWKEIIEIVPAAPLFGAVGAAVGYAVGVDPYGSGFIAMAGAPAAAYPLWKWMARKEVQNQEKKIAFLNKLEEVIQAEWERRGKE